MWPLTNGLRCLEGDEADLFRGAVGMLLDQLVFELNDFDSDDPDHDVHDHEDPNVERHENPFTDLALSEQAGELPDWLSDCVDEAFVGDSGFGSSIGHFDFKNDATSDETGFGFESPHWFAMWEPQQRVWLLERVAMALLTSKSAPPNSAIFEATVEAVYIELADLIAMEITTGSPIEKGSWRGSLLDAYVQRCPKDSMLGALQFEATTLDQCLPPAIRKQLQSLDTKKTESLDWMNWWTRVVERLVDATYGPRLYHEAEKYRDGDPRELRRYLRTKGVNDQFIRRIPPLRNFDQTQASIARLQAIVFQS